MALPYRCRVVHPTLDVFPASFLSGGLALSREFTPLVSHFASVHPTCVAQPHAYQLHTGSLSY